MEILKSDSAWLRLFLSLDAWLLKNIFPSIQKVSVSNNWPIIGIGRLSADADC